MSWLYSRVLVEEYLGDTSLDGKQSALSSGSHIQQAYCAPDKMTAFSRLSRFGMTYKPLTANLGEELLMSYLAAFHAPTFPQQEKVQELTEKPLGCGEKWHASFTKYSPVTHSWKTHQCSLLGGLDEFSEIWPQWGLMRDGECWEQRTLEQSIRGTEFGLLLPTPVSIDSGSGRFNTSIGSSVQRPTLALMARKNLWPTPRAQEPGRTTMGYGRGLAELVEGKKQRIPKLVQNWPTPTAHNAKETNAPSEANRNTPTLAAQAGGSLNPMWVEWLMGWPLGWTDLKPLATDKSHFVPQQHGES
jgi:hypothetical protein